MNHPKKRFGFSLVTFLIALPLSSAAPMRANPGSEGFLIGEPLCGVYCIYASAKLALKDVRFHDLVKTKYIGSRKGSSLVELKTAAEDCGMYAVALEKLTIRELRKSSCPIILHVKSTLDERRYDHYILFVRTEKNKAVLFDPPGSMRIVPFGELLPYWDGAGLYVSAESINAGEILAPARRRVFLNALIGIGIIFAIRSGRRRWTRAFKVRSQFSKLSIIQALGLIFLAFLAGSMVNYFNQVGLLAQPDVTAMVVKANQGKFLPRVNIEKMFRLQDANALFVDARLPPDYEAGHMEGAINIPIIASDEERKIIMTGVAKDRGIVVYCQSRGCDYAENVAVRLIEDGFTNISIARAGWNEWKARANTRKN